MKTEAEIRGKIKSFKEELEINIPKDHGEAELMMVNVLEWVLK